MTSNVAPPSRRHLPAGCRRYEQDYDPGRPFRTRCGEQSREHSHLQSVVQYTAVWVGTEEVIYRQPKNPGEKEKPAVTSALSVAARWG
jgi:hypothetical protein